MTKKPNKENSTMTSKVKHQTKKQDGRIEKLQIHFNNECHQKTASELCDSFKNVGNNCAICRTEYSLIDFKSSRICDECVQYIKDNY